MRNWKTTLLSALVAISLLTKALANQLDNDPATVPGWNEAFDVAIAAGIMFWGLFTKDSDK